LRNIFTSGKTHNQGTGSGPLFADLILERLNLKGGINNTINRKKENEKTVKKKKSQQHKEDERECDGKRSLLDLETEEAIGAFYSLNPRNHSCEGGGKWEREEKKEVSIALRIPPRLRCAIFFIALGAGRLVGFKKLLNWFQDKRTARRKEKEGGKSKKKKPSEHLFRRETQR